MTKTIRIGAVSYLNTKPLVYGLESLTPNAQIIYDLPSRLASQLAAGELDVALIPSVEFLRGADYTIVSDACIACRGPVMSVKLFSRVEPQSIQTLALDEGSRTSAALVQILLSERFGIRPKLCSLPIGDGLTDVDTDAVLLIGDRAMHAAATEFSTIWDLGDQWCRWTELPFVYAMWIAREDTDLDGIEFALDQARDRGVMNLEVIAREQACLVGLGYDECLVYLRDNLHFHLGTREVAGLDRFRGFAEQLGLIPNDRAITMRPGVGQVT